MTYAEIVHFHGHECPGLAIGYRMAKEGMRALGSLRAHDEELVAIVENDACGVDALQCVTGCTFGKGNLIFRDFGKQVFTLFNRSTRKGVRVVFHGKDASEEVRKDRDAFAKWILANPAPSMLTVTTVSVPEPEPAKIRKSIPCAICGEAVMESRTKIHDGAAVCIPCHEERTGSGNKDD